MSPNETVALLRLITGYHPGLVLNDQTPATWHRALADIPAADATRAVHAHYATTGPWIGVADIRRRVAAARGLLPPEPEDAYAQAQRMNTWLDKRTGPEPEIHPAAIAAARAMSWSTFDGPEGIAHRRFIEAYAPQAARAIERALTTPLRALEAEVRAPKALPGGSGAGPAVEGDGEAGETVAALRTRRAATTARLDEAIAELGADARFLLPRNASLDNRFGRAALTHRLTELGFDRDPGDALRRARLEIARHSESDEAADFEARRAAALRALEGMAGEAS